MFRRNSYPWAEGCHRGCAGANPSWRKCPFRPLGNVPSARYSSIKRGKDEIVSDSDAVIDLDSTKQARFTSAEQAGLARAVRASIRSQVIDLLDRHGLLHKSDLV